MGGITKNIRHKIIIAIAYGIVGGFLAIAGAVKLADPKSFVETLQNTGLLPDNLCYLIGYCLPILEIITGYLFLFESTRKSALLISTALYSAFSCWLILLFILGITMQCGCFGVWDPLGSSPSGSIMRSLLLLSLCAILLTQKNSRSTPKSLRNKKKGNHKKGV